MIRRNILKNFIKYQTRIYPKPMFFSEVVKKEEENIVVLKNEDLEKIIKKYNVPILKDYKEIKIQETDFEVMNIQKNATVRQIYTAYIHNQKILNLVDVTNREEKLKRLDDAYHKLIMNKIKISSNLQKAEQIDLDELLKTQLRLMSNTQLNKTQQIIQVAEANTEKVWSEPKNLLLYIGIGWVLMGVTSIILPP